MSQKDVSAWDVISQQLPQWWADPQTKDLRDGIQSVVPTTPLDLGMMMLGGPTGGMAKKVGAGLIAAGTGDAEAGGMGNLKRLFEAAANALGRAPTREEMIKIALESNATLQAKVDKAIPPIKRNLKFWRSLPEDPEALAVGSRIQVPTHDQLGKAYDAGFTRPGSRVVTQGPIVTRSDLARTPGMHVAPAGSEQQAIKVMGQQFLRDSNPGTPYPMRPEAQTVVSRMDNPILLTDEAAEFPDKLAAYTGLTDDYRKILSEVRGTPEQKASAITRLLRDHGVDSGIYKNLVERGNKGKNWSHVIFDDSNLELPSNFAGGGLVKAFVTIRDLPFRGNGALDVAKLTPEHLALLEKMSAADKRLVFRATPEEGLKPIDSGFEGLFAGRTPRGVLPYSEGTNLQGGAAPTLHMLKLDQPHSEFKSFNLLKPTDSTYSDPSAIMNDIQWGVRNGRSFEEIYEMLRSQGAGLTKKQLESALASKGLRFHNNPNQVDSTLTGEIGLFDPSTAGGTPAARLVGPDLEPYRIKYADGGHVGREHTRSSSQDASTQPVDNGWLAALRGYLAATGGIPGDIEGLGRAGINWARSLSDGPKVDPTPVLPTSEFYRDWFPGKQMGDASTLETLSSLPAGIKITSAPRAFASLGKAVAHAAPSPVAGGKLAQLGVIRATGDNNFLKGSVENALAGLKGKIPQLKELNAGRPKGAPAMTTDEYVTYLSGLRDVPLNKFVEGPLTRYVKQQMATPDDPVRALAEQGILHAQPNGPMAADLAKLERSMVKMPAEGKSDLAKAWENNADIAISPAGTAKQILDDASTPFSSVLAKAWAKDNSWLATKPPETNVFNTTPSMQNLGFDHLTDELRNALNPDSGLPRNLLLTPEKMANMGMEKAVRHVAAINDWRAAQEVAANAHKANNAATVLHKEYPHSDATPNPKGLRWVELKAPKTEQPDFEDALSDAYRPAYAALRDALKYEGDTMKHCAGGYCDDVLSGKKRIFSLRDAKGEPHVTIETVPSGRDPYAVAFDNLPKATRDQIRADAGVGPGSGFVSHAEQGTQGERIKALMVERYPEIANYEIPQSIVQIKRKANLVNSEPYEYRPFVQDFVKSGKWSDVGDLPNTGMRRSRDVFGPTEQQYLRDQGKTFGEYLDPDEIKALQDSFLSGPAPAIKFATGGRVSMIHPAAAIQPLVRVPGFDRF